MTEENIDIAGDEAGEGGGSPDQEYNGRDYESEALEQGWTPKEEFKGNPDKWVDAEKYVERGSYRKQVKDLSSQMAELKKQMESQSSEYSKKLSDELSRARKIAEHALDKQREQLEARYERLKYNAVEEGDLDEYKRLDSEHKEQVAKYSEPQFEEEVENEFKEPEKKPEENQQPEPPQEVKDWVSKNQWFERDQRLKAYAIETHKQIVDSNPNMSLPESLELVTEEIKNTFPQKFERPSQRTDVAGGNRINGGSANRKKGWGDIDKVNQEHLDFFIKKGIYKDKNEAAERFWSEE